MTEFISLVDEQDNIIGRGEKLASHKENQLHRAFSIFVFNNEGNLIIHRRALEKYHCGGLWTNTCCGHPRFGEDLNEMLISKIQQSGQSRQEDRISERIELQGICL